MENIILVQILEMMIIVKNNTLTLNFNEKNIVLLRFIPCCYLFRKSWAIVLLSPYWIITSRNNALDFILEYDIRYPTDEFVYN